MNGVRRTPLKITDYNGGFRSGSAMLPDSFCLPTELIPDVRNQGDVNSCVAFSVTNIIQIFNQKEAGKRDRFSPGYVYGRCRDEDDDRKGMIIPEALDYLMKTGAPFENDFPINEEVPEITELVRSRPDLDEKAKPYRIAGYEVYAWAIKERKYNAVKEALYSFRVPILGDFDLRGGKHAMAIIGWNDKTQTFRAVNSWGEEWGNGGIGDVAYSKLARGYLIMDAKNSEVLMPFEDVPESEWYCKAVKRVYNAGLMNGTSDKTFEPDRPMTRAEMAQVLSNLCDKINDIVKEDKNASGTSD